MKRLCLLVLCVGALVVIAGCQSMAPLADDVYINCLTVKELETMPRCRARVVSTDPSSVHLKTKEGNFIDLGGPAGAEAEVADFMETLRKGQTYTLPDAFLDFMKERQKIPEDL